MPDERLITEIENILNQVIELGAEKERTRIVPNLLVTDASPAGLSNYITVKDDRDGDNILAVKMPDIVYNTNDFVNVLFVRGGEAIAYQKGSGDTTGGIWSIVPATSTDIFYNSGDVAIGKASESDAALEIVDSAQAQLRLTHTDATKFVDFTLDTNHDLTITPSSNGQIVLQPTTDSNDFFQIFDADGGTPIVRIDAINEKVIITSDSTNYTEEGNVTRGQLFVERPDTGGLRGAVYITNSDSADRNSQNAFVRGRAGATAVQSSDRLGDFFWSGHDSTDYNRSARFGAIVDGAVSANTVPSAIDFSTSETNSSGLTQAMRIASDQDVIIGPGSTIGARLHIDQDSSAAAEPVLLLDQADVDEPFIKYVGTAAAATLTRSIVDNGDVSTATLVGWTKIEIDDIGNQVTDGDYYQPFYTLA